MIAEASTGVAQRLKRAVIATAGSASSHFAAQIALQAPRASKRGRSAASLGPQRIPHQAVSTTISVPGRIPPRNMLLIGTWAMIPHRISGRQGGKSRPSEPAPVIRPSAERSEYCAEMRIGIKSPPSARIVTPEAPVNEVKNAQTSAVMIAGPPRIEPKSCWKTRIRRFDAPPSAKK